MKGPVAPFNDVEQEHNSLLNRIAQLQQEKWNLEEKVKLNFFFSSSFYISYNT